MIVLSCHNDYKKAKVGRVAGDEIVKNKKSLTYCNSYILSKQLAKVVINGLVQVGVHPSPLQS